MFQIDAPGAASPGLGAAALGDKRKQGANQIQQMLQQKVDQVAGAADRRVPAAVPARRLRAADPIRHHDHRAAARA